MRFAAIASIVAALAATSPSYAPPHHSSMDGLPRLFLWAWERPEDLRDLDSGIGVAFLAQTITIAGSQLRVAPRRQPLRVAPTTNLIAVTRIEISESGVTLERPSIEAMSTAIAATARLPRVAAVQIDFDATASERVFYRELIQRLRDRMPSSVPISITALASWCAGDDWLGGLPIDEAVPMLFRMGAVNEPFRRIAGARDLAAPPCRGAVGTSLDEPIDTRSNGRRIYVFNPRPWTESTLFQARKRVIE